MTGRRVWTSWRAGRDRLGRGGGRRRRRRPCRDLLPRGRAPARAAPADAPPEGPAPEALCAAPAGGASFWDDLLAEAAAPREEVFAALWGLVWAGEVINDLWLPLRALRRCPSCAAPRPDAGAWAARPPCAVGGGRTLVAVGVSSARAPPEGERRRALAELMVERHGILTRPAALAEGVSAASPPSTPPGRTSRPSAPAVAATSSEGLGGAQFAMPGAVERLRDLRDAPPDEGPHAIVLGAADPAQPYGAAVPWPRREGAPAPHRASSAARSSWSTAPRSSTWSGADGACSPSRPATAPDALKRGPSALAGWITSDRRRVSVERVDGEPVFESPLERPLADAGFQPDLRGMVLLGADRRAGRLLRLGDMTERDGGSGAWTAEPVALLSAGHRSRHGAADGTRAADVACWA